MPKVYRQHNCARKHRTFLAMAKCIWRRAVWITGEGPYATVSRCAHGPYELAVTVRLHADLDSAQSSLKLINDTGCGGRCSNRHELVELQR
ncbi:hypothetical protein GCM10027258_57750 [Amycolatopsis stemonae]